MALVTFASATGSPGTTTTALALALSWPRAVVLVDGDRDPAQAIAAGYLNGVDLGGRGMSSLARAHREQRRLAAELPLHWVDLEGGEHARHVVPGFGRPGAAALFRPVWPDLVDALVGLGDEDTDALVDIGRLREGLPPALAVHSDLAVVCVRSSLRGLAALRLHLPVLQAQLAEGGTAELGLVVIGPGRPYGVGEIEDQFGVPVFATMAWEPRQAEVFSDGAPAPRGLGGGTLVRSARQAASALGGRIRHRSEVLAGDRDVAQWGLA